MAVAMSAAKKREMEDNSRRIGALFWKLNEGQVSAKVVQKLQQMSAALDAGNWPAAQHIQVGTFSEEFGDSSMNVSPCSCIECQAENFGQVLQHLINAYRLHQVDILFLGAWWNRSTPGYSRIHGCGCPLNVEVSGGCIQHCLHIQRVCPASRSQGPILVWTLQFHLRFFSKICLSV